MRTPRALLRHGNPWWVELIVVIAFYQAYGRLRALAGGDAGAALHNARQLVHAEEAVGLFHEATVQSWFLGHETLLQLWDVYYGVAHFVVPAVAFVVLWRRDRTRYRVWRDTFGAMLLMALVGFAVYPVMPPRLLPPPHHFVDTVQVYGGMGPLTESNASAANLFAAMPSLHIGWSTWSVAALWPVVRRRAWRVLLVAYPIVTLTAVVVTANHYIVDGLAGVATLVVAWSAATGLRRRLSRTAGPSPSGGPGEVGSDRGREPARSASR